MSDRDLIEEQRIEKSYKAAKEQQNQAKRKRNLKLAIICVIFSVIVIFGVMLVVLNSISDKEELREQGIAAFNDGKNTDAVDLFKKSLDEKQLFSQEMDQDTRLYLAAAYIRMEKYKEALSVYNEIRENPGGNSIEKLDSYISVTKALQNVKEGNITDDDINSLHMELSRGNKSINLYLGTCYKEKGKTEEMLKYYNDYVSEFGMNTYVSFQLSSYYLDKKDQEKALSYINQGLSASDDLFKDKVLFNEIVYYERNHDYQTAFEKAESLTNSFPENETYQKEYKFLYSRVNIDPTPVHTKSDDEEETETEE